MIAHAVIDHRDSRAFSFLSGAAALDLEQWSEVIEAEVRRRRHRKQDLERAVRRLRAIVEADAGTPLRSWIVAFIDEVGFRVKHDCALVAGEAGYIGAYLLRDHRNVDRGLIRRTVWGKDW